MKLAYLSHIFGMLNKLNRHLQGREQHLPQLQTRSGFTEAEMWKRRLDRWNEFELILMQLDGSHIHYRSKVWDHLEMSLFFKEKHCFFQ